MLFIGFFFFKQKTAYDMRISDWSSDVCSSDLIPIGLMLGILLAFRKLALSSEIDALRSVGFSYWRLLRVPYIYACALALLNLGIVGYIQPYARYAYEGLRFELRSGALGASIKVGEFAKIGRASCRERVCQYV